MICKVCGNDLGDAKFCTVCGTQVTSLEGGSGYETQAVDAGAGVMAAPQKPNFIKNVMNGKKKLLIAATAIVLVVAIALGLIFGLQSKEVKLFNALRKTIFNSKSLTVEIGNEAEVKVVFGEGIDGTDAEIEVEGEGTYEIKDGKVTFDGESQTIDELLKEAQSSLDEYGLDINIEEELNKIITGKINEKEFAKLYDSTIKPALEEAISGELGADIELPTYDKTMKLVKKFLNSLSKDAVTVKKDGKKYKVTVKMADFMSELVIFCQETKEINNILKEIDGYDDFMDKEKDEIEDEMKDSFGSEKVKFEVKLSGGRISEFEADGLKIKIKDINKTKV